MKIFVCYLIFICCLLCFTSGEGIDKLINKLCTIAKTKLHVQEYTPDERQQILQTLKEKLMKASKGFETSAYVRLIVQGVIVLADENNYQKLCKDQIAQNDAQRRKIYQAMFPTNTNISTAINADVPSEEIDSVLNSDNPINKTKTIVIASRSGNEEESGKSNAIKELSKKMEIAVRKNLKGLSTHDEKLKKIAEVKKQFVERFQKTANGSDVESKVKVLEAGMDAVVKRVLTDETRRDNAGDSLLETDFPDISEILDEKNKTHNKNPSRKSNQKFQQLNDKMEKTIRKYVAGVSALEAKLDKISEVKRKFLENFRKLKQGSSIGEVDEKAKVLAAALDEAANKVLGDTRRLITQQDLITQPTTETIAEKSVTTTTNEPDTKKTSKTSSITTEPPLDGVTKEYGCSDIMQEACTDLKNLENFVCSNDGTTIHTNEVCDGKLDCADGSDEINCIQHIITKINGATKVMSKLELNRYCFRSIIDNSLLGRQSELLSKLLNTQIKFLKKYTNHMKQANSTKTVKARRRSGSMVNVFDAMGIDQFLKKYHYEDQVNLIVNEVAIIVRSFGSTLVGALCTNENRDIIEKIEKMTKIDFHLDEDLGKNNQIFSSKSCACNGPICSNVTTCSSICKRYCYHVESLVQFSCKSMKRGESGISLNAVCDGKLDCYDRADETNCPVGNSLSKFQISQSYDSIISYLTGHTTSHEYEYVRPLLVELGGAIQKLHSIAISTNLNIDSLRIQRDKIFDLIKEAYMTMWYEINGHEQQEKVYNVFKTLGKQLIDAMRLTHFGNYRVLKADECYCRGAECGAANCSKHCERSCMVKDTLTRYTCNDDSNVSVPIDVICNGKINCPTAEDEINCSTDVCRNHHLRVLRANIHDTIEKEKTSIFGIALGPWKAKVDSALTVLANEGQRLTPRVFKRTVSQILSDLSLNFLEDEKDVFNSTTGPELKKYKIFAQSIIESLKDCTK